MTPDQRLLLIGGYISSALYLSGCFVAGLALNVPVASKNALLAAGFNCGAYLFQLAGQRQPAVACSVFSWIAGALAGVWLIFGV